jgi:hypothetical protein
MVGMSYADINDEHICHIVLPAWKVFRKLWQQASVADLCLDA